MSIRRLPIGDHDGIECIDRPIGKKGLKGNFICYKESWERFLKLGYSDKTTFTLKGGHVYFSDGKKTIALARVFKQAKNDQEVTYANGDKLDLRLPNLGTRQRRGRAMDIPVAKVAPARQPWRIDPSLIDGGAESEPVGGGIFDPEKLIVGARKVNTFNFDHGSAADAYIAWLDDELNRAYGLRAGERGVVLPTRGKTYGRWSAK